MKNQRRFALFPLIFCVIFALSACCFAETKGEASPPSASEWAKSGKSVSKTKYPVTIVNGNRKISFASSPERVVTNGDSNIIELMFALGLEGKMVGYAGFPYYGYEVSPRYKKKLKQIPLLSDGYIKLEKLLFTSPDFFLSGYYYGLDIPGDCTENCITPEELARYGIASYAISESLVRVMKKPPVSMEEIGRAHV